MAAAENTKTEKTPTRFLVIHGDKGGVGKSFVAQALADFIDSKGEPIAVIDADTRNADVSRMFDGKIPCTKTNLETDNGWMDVMDFVEANPGHTIILNTPGGIGSHMQKHIHSLAAFLKKQKTSVEMELWWTMSLTHDSVTLLNEAIKDYGQHFVKVRVVCNLHFAGGDKNNFLDWNESPFRTTMENKGGLTLYFPGLHVRVVKKLFTPTKTTPFSEAQEAGTAQAIDLSSSERYKLGEWIMEVSKLFNPAFGYVR